MAHRGAGFSGISAPPHSQAATVNQGFTYTEQIGSRHAGASLAAYLGRFEHTPEAEWSERIREGKVQIDGQKALPEQRLRVGQIVTWVRPPWQEPEAPLHFTTLYEDEDLLAVDKPSGLPTLAGAGFLEHTLIHLVRQRCPEASPIHRLGRGTSGIVIFARSSEASAQLSQALREHTMTKIYRALVSGEPDQDAFSIHTPIGPVEHTFLGTVHAASPSGKHACSHVRVLERRGASSLVEVHIETGRPHQIRIHMAAAGHPLVGDPLYAIGGQPKSDTTSVPGDLGYLLHAYRVNPPHPRTGGRIALSCAPPPELRLEGETCVHHWERTTSATSLHP